MLISSYYNDGIFKTINNLCENIINFIFSHNITFKYVNSFLHLNDDSKILIEWVHNLVVYVNKDDNIILHTNIKSNKLKIIDKLHSWKFLNSHINILQSLPDNLIYNNVCILKNNQNILISEFSNNETINETIIYFDMESKIQKNHNVILIKIDDLIKCIDKLKNFNIINNLFKLYNKTNQIQFLKMINFITDKWNIYKKQLIKPNIESFINCLLTFYNLWQSKILKAHKIGIK